MITVPPTGFKFNASCYMIQMNFKLCPFSIRGTGALDYPVVRRVIVMRGSRRLALPEAVLSTVNDALHGSWH
jgi:hypothetical protein